MNDEQRRTARRDFRAAIHEAQADLGLEIIYGRFWAEWNRQITGCCPISAAYLMASGESLKQVDTDDNDHHLEVLRVLWNLPVAYLEGFYYGFDDAHFDHTLNPTAWVSEPDMRAGYEDGHRLCRELHQND